MSGTILVTGGTGNLGGLVVRRLAELGRPVRVLSRRPAPSTDGGGSGVGGAVAGSRAARTEVTGRVEHTVGDLNTRAGLTKALTGVEVVVHCATDSRRPSTDLTATGHLIEAADATGLRPHLVYISIIGVDRHPLPYYQTKHQTEHLIQVSGLPWTILRAAQFHDLLLLLLHYAARLPVVPVLARTSFQPVDAAAVAERLAELALSPPAGRVPDLAGPQTLTMRELARAYLRATNRHRPVVPVRLPGKVAGAFRQGLHLAPEPNTAGRTFDEFLAGST